MAALMQGIGLIVIVGLVALGIIWIVENTKDEE